MCPCRMLMCGPRPLATAPGENCPREALCRQPVVSGPCQCETWSFSPPAVLVTCLAIYIETTFSGLPGSQRAEGGRRLRWGSEPPWLLGWGDPALGVLRTPRQKGWGTEGIATPRLWRGCFVTRTLAGPAASLWL